MSPETTDRSCPEVMAVTGRPRDLVFGPYVGLAPGLWRAAVFVDVGADASRCRFDLEFGVFPNFTKIPVTFAGPGCHRLEIEHTVVDGGAAEVRLVLIRPNFQGEIRFAGASVERIGDVPASAQVLNFPMASNS